MGEAELRYLGASRVAANARASQAQMKTEYETTFRAVQDHPLWPKSKRYTAAEYSWAKTVISTRAFHIDVGGETELRLIPLIDTANSHSQERNTAVVCDSERETCNLVATRLIEAGEQVYVCYDHKISFVQTFERYGFLDKGSKLHAVELALPEIVTSTLSDPETPGWKRALLQRALQDGGGGGGDDDNGGGDKRGLSSWLSLVGLDCPLVSALRVCAMKDEEEDPAKKPTKDEERAALAALLSVLTRALAEYKKAAQLASPVQQHARALPVAASNACELTCSIDTFNQTNALQLAQYEATILLQKKTEVVACLSHYQDRSIA